MYPIEGTWDENIQVGENDTLTFALRFELQNSYFGFIGSTLIGLRIFPQHIWEGSGKYCTQSELGSCKEWETDIHEDFGYAYDPVIMNGRPTDDMSAFDIENATSWDPGDKYVVGTGPFRFTEWEPDGLTRLSKYEDFHVDSLDKDGSRYLHRPYIDEILFKIYKTTQSAVYALQAGEVGIVSWCITPEFVWPLIQDSHVDIAQTSSKGFYYLGYNMRMSPFGYPENDPSGGDEGLHLRKTIAHVIDKKTLVITVLQNFGVAGDQPVSPAYARWYNMSVPRYGFDLQEARQILDDYYTIGGHELGYGPSGYRNLPGIDDNEIELLTFQSDFDPRCRPSAEMMASNMREIGLNIKVSFRAYGHLMEIINRRDADMWILDEDVSSDPPEYYYDLFHSANSVTGKNHAGFQNASLDGLLVEARAQLDIDKQAELIKQSSGLLADALPYDVLFFRTYLEPYRNDRFVNWTLGRTGSYIRESFWSLIGIHPPFRQDLRLSISAPSAMASSDSTIIAAIVRDADGDVVPNVEVEMCVRELSISWFPGNLTVGDKTDTCVVGTSDLNGAVSALYQAPSLEGDDVIRVSISASARVDFRVSRVDWVLISIYPPETQFLSVRINMETGDMVPIGSAIHVEVEVTNQNNVPLDGVNVTLGSVPEGLHFEPQNGTTVRGSIGSIVVTPPSHLQEDLAQFNILAAAELEDHEPSTAIAEIVVFRPSPAPIDRDSAWQLWLIAGMIGLIVVLVIVSAVSRYVRGTEGEKDSK